MISKTDEFRITLDKGFDPHSLVLVKEGNEAETRNGRVAQSCHAAYIDGYLTACGELSRFITRLWQTDKETAAIVYHALEKFTAFQNESYTAMCERLNDKVCWDAEAII